MGWKNQVKEFESAYNYADSKDWRETENLKNKIANFHERHPNSGLPIELLQLIVDWKLRGQKGRTKKHREKITKSLWEQVTACALSIEHPDPDIRACVQAGILGSLPGVGIGLATAILALTEPDIYGIIDFRVWKIVFGTDKQTFSDRDYIRYLHELRSFANETGWPVQKVDFMLWTYYEKP
ncbi:MAG: hypothetical protein PHX10_05425 [Gallionellaceae bacterium]|nr:hypothetical protein [Gallionellaceae bacterium]